MRDPIPNKFIQLIIRQLFINMSSKIFENFIFKGVSFREISKSKTQEGALTLNH